VACGTTSEDETLLRHTKSGDNTGGVGSNRDVTVGNRGAVEIDE
jgi:hypothetical protein